MRRRGQLSLLLLTLSGMILGLLADLFAGGMQFELTDVALAVAMSPLLATIGGGAVSSTFLVAGLLFWPGWAVLAWFWLGRRRSAWVAFLIVAWSTQGFFQLLHRLALVMTA
jgi:hypothetical protein